MILNAEKKTDAEKTADVQPISDKTLDRVTGGFDYPSPAIDDGKPDNAGQSSNKIRK